MMVLPVVMQRDTVELLKRIRNFRPRSGQATVERHALDVAHGTPAAAVPVRRSGTANVDARALFDVAEVDRVRGAALVRDHRRLHVSQQSPLRGAEESMVLDVGRAGAGAQTATFVFDEELADDGFTKAMRVRLALVAFKNHAGVRMSWGNSPRDLRSPAVFGEGDVVP